MKDRSNGAASRRAVLAGAMAVLLVRPARATPETMAAALRDFVGEAEVRRGGVVLDVPPLVENGNSVPVTVMVDSPMTEQDFVKTIALFNERNPQPNIALFHLGPRSGRATVSTRIRLGDTQQIVAVAQLGDGTYWSAAAELIVTLPACAES